MVLVYVKLWKLVMLPDLVNLGYSLPQSFEY
jgi:hypothetical protein